MRTPYLNTYKGRYPSRDDPLVKGAKEPLPDASESGQGIENKSKKIYRLS